MPVCTNGHDQPDFAKFCGTCGSVVNPVLEGVLSPPTSSPVAVAETSPLDLDLMLDDNEIDDVKDVEDEEIDLGDDEAVDDEDEADDDEDEDQTTDEDNEPDEDDDSDSDALTAPPIFGTTVSADAMKMLLDWAEEMGELEDPYVAGLTKAVSRRDDLSMWAALDPLELLPLTIPKIGKRISRASSIVAALRNILVFLPVLITWRAIGHAIDAFGLFTREYAKLNPGYTSLNFIEFWQNPTEYKSGWWKTNFPGKEILGASDHIGRVAAIDATIILIIILLTIATGVLTWFAENREMIALEEAGRKRVKVGLAIASTLHGKRQATPESISEALAEALNDLTQAARDVNETASRLEKASIGVESLTPRIEILNSHTEQLVAQTATSVSKAVNDLVSSVQNLNTSIGGNVTSLFSDAANTLEEVSKQLARTSNSAEYGIKQLRDDLDAIHKQLQTFTKGGRS